MEVLLILVPERTLIIYAALNFTGIGQHASGPGYLWMRVPLQVFLFAWALWPVMSPDPKQDDFDGAALRPR